MSLSSVTGASSILQPGVCTSTTRPASPYDGQVIYETDTDKVAVYDSSSWVYKTGTSHVAPALVLISTTTVGTGVSSVTVSNCFSATYLNYKIWYNGNPSSADNDLKLTLGSATANYNQVFVGASYSSNAFVGAASQNASGFIYSGASETVAGAYASIDLFNPFETKHTRMFGQMGNVSNAGYIGGILKDTTSHTGFTFTPASGTLTGGTIRVYGYALS